MRGMMRLALLGVPGAQGGAVPTNTVAPAIETDAVIGTEIVGDEGTWTPAPDSYAYQWQRYTSGAWADIVGAINKDYTPVDADFGRALRLVVGATSDTQTVLAPSNETALTAEIPAQMLGANEVVNGDMETGNPPTGWPPAVGTADGAADERTGGTGVQCLQLTSTAEGTTYPVVYKSVTVSSPNAFYLRAGWARNIETSWVSWSFNNPNNPARQITGTAWMEMVDIARITDTYQATNLNAMATAAGQRARWDDATLKKLTRNAPLVAPSADMMVSLLYELPETPAYGEQIWLLLRIDSDGNWWNAQLEYTGTRWDIKLNLTASDAKTAKITSTNIGATNGIRVTASGNLWTLETTADDGENWTQRGTTIEDATYQEATGVNAIWSPNVIIERLIYEDAPNPT